MYTYGVIQKHQYLSHVVPYSLARTSTHSHTQYQTSTTDHVGKFFYFHLQMAEFSQKMVSIETHHDARHRLFQNFNYRKCYDIIP
jgi:hypothetical protein